MFMRGSRTRSAVIGALALVILAFSGPAVQSVSAPSLTHEDVREEKTLIVNGHSETWQLVWIGAHTQVCGPEVLDMAGTCPCAGLAFGEYGNLWLVRKRKGVEIERMDLRPLFGHSDYPMAEELAGKAWLQKQPLLDEDLEIVDGEGFRLLPSAATRPLTTIMNPGDYNHDGQATEFLIQVGTLPCGKLQFALVGLSGDQMKLHAFHAEEDAKALLILPHHVWDGLLKTGDETRSTIWECGDHGSEVRSEVTIYAAHGRIHVSETDTACAS